VGSRHAQARRGALHLPALLTAPLLLLSAASGRAQTSDPLFAGFRFAPPSVGSRPAGMGGAFVALADDAKAAVVNPAGLTLIPIRELGGSLGPPWLSASTGRPGLRLAGYVTRFDESQVELAEEAPPFQGSLTSSVLEAGLAAGVQLHPRLRVGGSLAWSRLRLDGARLAAADGASPAASVEADEGALRGSVGVTVLIAGRTTRAIPALRLGVSYQPGFDWRARYSDAQGAREIEVRRPTLVSFGLAWRASGRWAVMGQGDVIRYSEVRDTLSRNSPEDEGFRMPNVIEPRLGTEFATPLSCGCGIVRVRAGVHYQAPGTLGYEGLDPARRLAFADRSWRTVATLGASFVSEYSGNGLRLDVDSRDVFEGPELSFGIAWRF
jgi:hypothetical protein